MERNQTYKGRKGREKFQVPRRACTRFWIGERFLCCTECPAILAWHWLSRLTLKIPYPRKSLSPEQTGMVNHLSFRVLKNVGMPGIFWGVAWYRVVLHWVWGGSQDEIMYGLVNYRMDLRWSQGQSFVLFCFVFERLWPVTLDDTLHQMDLINVFWAFHLKAAEYTFFSSAHIKHFPR